MKYHLKKEKVIYFRLCTMDIWDYDNSNNKIFIPNNEILEIFKNFIKSDIWKDLNKNSKIFNPEENDYIEFSKNNYFVNKTKLILRINHIIDFKIIKNICITRSRGFGKTVTANMLQAYYSFTESKITVFDDKKISKSKGWDKNLGKHNVILLNNINYFFKILYLNELKKLKNQLLMM